MSGEGVLPAAPESTGAPTGMPIANPPFTPAQEARLLELWLSFIDGLSLDSIGSTARDGAAFVITGPLVIEPFTAEQERRIRDIAETAISARRYRLTIDESGAIIGSEPYFAETPSPQQAGSSR